MASVQYHFDSFHVLPSTRQVRRGGEAVELPRLVFDCALYLLEHRERAIGRDELVAAVWGRVDVADTQLSQLIRRLRQHLGDDAHQQKFVQTIPGFGYRWAAPVSASAADEAEPEPASAPVEGDPTAGVAGSSPARPHAPLRGRAWLALAAAAAFVLVCGGILARVLLPRSGAEISEDRAIVLPLDVAASATDAWLRLGGMDLVAQRLRSAGMLVPRTESMVAALDAKADSPRGNERIAALFGAELIVSGTVEHAPPVWHVKLVAKRGDDPPEAGQAEDADAIRALHVATDRLAIALGRRPAPGPDVAGESWIQPVRAAILANQIATARSLLDDARGQMDGIEWAYWQARVEFGAARWDEAASLLDDLLGSEEAVRDPSRHARILIARAGVHIRTASYAEAESAFDAAARLLAAGGSPAEHAEALAGRGVARAALGRMDEALADLGQARGEMERAGDTYGAIRVDANRGIFELARDRPADALPWLQDAARRFEEFGAVGPVLSTLDAVSDAHAMLLQWDEALAVDERRWALRQKADPMQGYLMGVDRSRTLLAVGRLGDAEQTLDTIEADYPGMRRPIAQGLNAMRAELAWARGRHAEALLQARQGLADAPCRTDGFPCDTLGLIYQRALVASGDIDREAVPPVLRDIPPDEIPESAFVDVVRAEWAAARGDKTAAEANFSAGLRRATHAGTPADLVRVVNAYSRWLIGEKRLDEAAAVAGQVAFWADQDFSSALLQLELTHAIGAGGPQAAALARVQGMAGERVVPVELADSARSVLSLRP
ncbi:MAG: winged helix-turn-helix domain-containing protein [Xanthomonadales bacterium]|nr:winged helix-turn-helix domain-containing protein [Xanthomonadales bacterium]